MSWVLRYNGRHKTASDMPSENIQSSFRDDSSYSFAHAPAQFQLDKNREKCGGVFSKSVSSAWRANVRKLQFRCPFAKWSTVTTALVKTSEFSWSFVLVPGPLILATHLRKSLRSECRLSPTHTFGFHLDGCFAYRLREEHSGHKSSADIDIQWPGERTFYLLFFQVCVVLAVRLMRL